MDEAERLLARLCEITKRIARNTASMDECLEAMTLRDAVLAAMRKGGVPQWQTIDSAPKDGTWVLVHFKRHGWMSVSWQDIYENGSGIWCVDDHKHGPYAVRGYNDGDDTHWMPLPAAPGAAAPQPPPAVDPQMAAREGWHGWYASEATAIIKALLACPEIADCGADCKDAETETLESRARQFLAAAPQPPALDRDGIIEACAKVADARVWAPADIKRASDFEAAASEEAEEIADEIRALKGR